MPTPRRRKDYESEAIYGAYRRTGIASEDKQRCRACGALLASDNQQGISGSGFCSPCYRHADAKETTMLGLVMMSVRNPIHAYKNVTGHSPGIEMRC